MSRYCIEKQTDIPKGTVGSIIHSFRKTGSSLTKVKKNKKKKVTQGQLTRIKTIVKVNKFALIAKINKKIKTEVKMQICDRTLNNYIKKNMKFKKVKAKKEYPLTDKHF